MKEIILGLVVSIFFYGNCIAEEMNLRKLVELGPYKVVIINEECPSDKITSIFNKKTKESLYAFSCTNTKITIQNAMLFVNGEYYGDLQDTDSITLSEGKVEINEIEQQIKEDPAEKIMAKLAPKETKEVISGYEVTFVPGFQGFKMSFSGGEQTLDNGRIKVTIGKDKLTVNDHDCGRLIKGDTILIQDNDVIVSGQKRWTIADF